MSLSDSEEIGVLYWIGHAYWLENIDSNATTVVDCTFNNTVIKIMLLYAFVTLLGACEHVSLNSLYICICLCHGTDPDM